MARIVIEEPCEHGWNFWMPHLVSEPGYGGRYRCPGGSRRVLDPGSYVLVEKRGNIWPMWAEKAADPFEVFAADDGKRALRPRYADEILDALAGGEQP